MTLRESWTLRNAAAETLIRSEEQFRRALETATIDDIITLLESFSPARSPGPEWTRSFEPLIERLWVWCDPELLATAEAEFRGRGAPWAAVANALSPDHGEHLRHRLTRQSSAGRLPHFTIG